MKIQYEILENKKMILAVTYDRDQSVAKTRMIEAFGTESQHYTFELKVTQRGVETVTYFYYVETSDRPTIDGISYLEINRSVKATIIEGTKDELLLGAATSSFQSFMKENKLVWDVSKAFLLLEEPQGEQVVFYLPIR